MSTVATHASLPSEANAIGDLVTLVVWSLLALFALWLVLRLPRGVRGTWLVVAAYCSVVAIDKSIDLQSTFYRLVQWGIDLLDPSLGLRRHRTVLRIALLVPLTALAVGGTLWLVRRDRRLDRARLMAITGLVLVLLLVGLRLLPGLEAIDETTGWIVEGIACACVGCGLRMGWPRLAKPVDGQQ